MQECKSVDARTVPALPSEVVIAFFVLPPALLKPQTETPLGSPREPRSTRKCGGSL